MIYLLLELALIVYSRSSVDSSEEEASFIDASSIVVTENDHNEVDAVRENRLKDYNMMLMQCNAIKHDKPMTTFEKKLKDYRNRVKQAYPKPAKLVCNKKLVSFGMEGPMHRKQVRVVHKYKMRVSGRSWYNGQRSNPNTCEVESGVTGNWYQ